MYKLTKIKSKYHVYYKDNLDRRQGKQSWMYYNSTQLYKTCFFKDDEYHGEAKWWTRSGLCSEHQFYQNNINITKEVKELVKDFNNITHKERVLIKLKFGIECLC